MQDRRVQVVNVNRRFRDAVTEIIRRSVGHPRLHTTSTHGTGCTLSSAIAARLASGDDLARAVEGAIGYLHGAMAAAFPLGKGNGHGPVDHFYLWRGKRSFS